MEFKSFDDFYPFYLRQHRNLMTRRLHFIGTSFVITLLLAVFFTGKWGLFLFIPVFGYGFAWIGHMVYEKNHPATFKHPVFSLLGDFRMFWEILTGRLAAF